MISNGFGTGFWAFGWGMEVGEENLRDFVAGSVPTVYYVPDFITDSEQDQLLTNV